MSDNQYTQNPYDAVYGTARAQKPYADAAAEGAQSSSAGTAHAPSQGAPAYAAPVQAPVAPKQSKGWIVAIVVIVALCLIVLTSIVSCSSVMGSVGGSFSSFGTSGSYDRADEASIVVIDIDGTIQYDGTSCSPEGLKAQLDRAESDSNVKGVILRVNSGGGVATAGEEMSIYVRDFDKPIVVSSASTNASAAYEISSQADYIFTARTTSIGAIGVALEVTDLSGLYDKLGIKIDTITSSESKDSSYGNRPLTEEERAWYQRIVDQISNDFINTVAEGRHMDVEEVRALANGLPYTGEDAVENGLADEIGTFEDALAHISMQVGYSHPLPTIDYKRRESDLATLLDLLSESSSEGNKIDLTDLAERLKAHHDA